MKEDMSRILSSARRKNLVTQTFCLLASALVLLSPTAARALNGTWAKGASGNWSDSANWLGNQIADGAGFTCEGQALSGGPRTITVDSPRTIGRIFMNCNGTGRTYIFDDPTGANPITLSGATTTNQVFALNGQLEMHVELTGTANVQFVGQNSGGIPVMYLYATNTYTGNTEIISEGPLRIAVGVVDAIPHGPGKGNVILNSIGSHGYGTLDIRESSITINGLIGAAGVVTASFSVSSGTSTLTVGDADANGTFSGQIADSSRTVALTKIGAGTQILNGTNSYAGLTTVNGGALVINGSITGNAQVDGGTLGGNGSIGGSVGVTAGGNVGAGASVGTLTIAGGLDLSAGGTNTWEIGANSDSNPGVDFDQIVLTGGNLDVSDSTLVVKFVGTADGANAFWSSSHSWTVISLNGGANPLPSNFSKVVNASNANGNFTTAADGGGNIVLTFTPGAPQAAKPTITTISGAGTTTVTVNYTNTVPTKSYTLRYRTNLSTTNWTTVGSQVAAGTSDSQTDSSATTSPRFYQVFYLAP